MGKNEGLGIVDSGVEATYSELQSTWGHDALLIEVEEQAHLVSHFLKKAASSL